MAVEIIAPQPGESVTEVFISAWLKKNGDVVQANEPIVEFESDKAPQKLEAPVTGVLRIDVPEGKTVPVRTVVGRIDEKAAAPAKGANRERHPLSGGRQPTESRTAQGADAPRSEGDAPGEVLLSPAARQLAADQGIDPRKLSGTGRGGRITKEDVLAHAGEKKETKPGPARAERDNGPSGPPLALPAAPPAPQAPPLATPVSPGARETRQRMSAIRQRIAERLLSAQQNAAILTTFNEADLSAVMALRTRYKETFQKKHGVGLGFMGFFVKACVEALKAFPAANARIDGTDIVYQHFYDIGVAVSTERGLMVPVLRDCDRLSFAGVEKGIAALAQKAREEKITVNDLQGGTFTITNGGVFGSLLSTPILNPPQSAILGMHAIQKRPVAVEEQVVIRPMMYLALSYDHRIIDGREAVSFLVRVKECIENPERMLLEI